MCTTVTGSSHHSCALSCDGKLFTWGRNSDGCLGRKTFETDSAEPELIDSSSTWANGAIESGS
jgi:alpha-tubulin suppressor-like RCC1 family protein